MGDVIPRPRGDNRPVHQTEPLAQAVQRGSAGDSSAEIHAAALEAAAPRPELTWLDVGCGTGKLLRLVRDRHRPAALVGVDVIDWLDDDLRGDVRAITGPAEDALDQLAPADRVLLVESLEHFDAPWTVLRAAARLVAPGGRIVVTTPNIANLRHRLELPIRGGLTAFRPDHAPHQTPVLAHVVQRILSEEGLAAEPPGYAARDVIPWTNGRRWPAAIRSRAPMLASIALVVTAERPLQAV
jgi:2-polyprenyl-3-methyl-5-hydroxy-6-metoxy-1,4-benzoquinol methylase